MDGLIQLAQQYPKLAAYIAIASVLYNIFKKIMSKIADSLDMPTPADSRRYRFWFKMANEFADNSKRASLPPIEQSPNFLPAAEAYMRDRLKKLGIAIPNQD